MPETLKEGGMPKRYPSEFRRKVLDLLAAGRSVAEIADDLEISDGCIYNWRKQDRIDRGEVAGLSSIERNELTDARRRISALEAELAATKRAKELLKEAVPPKGRFAIIAVMVEEGHSIKVRCRVLSVTEGGFYAWRKRPPSERTIRHTWLTDLITQIHVDSRGTYGARRVYAELTLGHGIVVGHNAVEMLMRRAGLQGLPNKRRFKTKIQVATAADLVERSFGRTEPNQLWVTDIERHVAPTNRAVMEGHRLRAVAAACPVGTDGLGGKQPRQSRDDPVPPDGSGPASKTGRCT